MVNSYSIHIPDWHPATLNKLMRNRWASAKLKKSDREIIAHYFRNVPKAKGKRFVHFTITLRKGQRAADPDAYYKSLLDSLVHAKMLMDDNRQGVEISQPAFIRGERMATLITIGDCINSQ